MIPRPPFDLVAFYAAAAREGFASAELAQAALDDVCRAYETKVGMTLDHWLPPHTDECDQGFTQRLCLRCDVLANIQIAFGFARPLNVALSRAAVSQSRGNS